VQGRMGSALQGKQRRRRRWYGFGLHAFGYYDIAAMVRSPPRRSASQPGATRDAPHWTDSRPLPDLRLALPPSGWRTLLTGPAPVG
jgi:hypothetical protein